MAAKHSQIIGVLDRGTPWPEIEHRMSSVVHWGDRDQSEGDILLDNFPRVPLIETSVLKRMVARMQRTHERRRASMFVGPPGIGKSTAIEAFKVANPRGVMVARVMKRGVTGPQALQQLLLALRQRAARPNALIAHSSSAVQHCIEIELEKAARGLRRDDDPGLFPLLTIVFDEAQRLTNGAIDALRDYNEPHYLCRGTFPLGMIFVGNDELSLHAEKGGKSILDEGMADRLLYRERLSYDDVERQDLDRFVRAQGVTDEGAITAIVESFFGKFNQQRSFRRVEDFVDELRDEALDQPISSATVRAVLGM